MDINFINEYLGQYGTIVLFIIILLEYMNLPGFPAGIILPIAGIWSANGGSNFWVAVIVSVMAGLIGSWILYFIGRIGGEFLLNKYITKFPKQEACINKNINMLREKGYKGVFISKLLPMIRTIASIPAGVLKMDFLKFSIYSFLGIFVWNLGFMATGYLFGDQVLQLLARI